MRKELEELDLEMSLEEFLNFVEKEQDKNWEEDHKENNKEDNDL